MSIPIRDFKKYQKGIAVELRQKGFSYSDIQNSIRVARSTLSKWLKEVKLTEEQKEKLKNKRLEGGKRGIKKRLLKFSERIRELESSSIKNIGKISKRELWLMGVILYWRDRNKNDFKNGVYFSSSNPKLISFFVRWLNEVGGIDNNDIAIDIFGKKRNVSKDLANYWSKETGLSKKFFTNLYPQKKASKGFLRVRVKSSSMLARQIMGWVKGIQEFIKA